MRPNETSPEPEVSALDRREFLRLSGALAAAGALATTGCQPPQESTIPFHDMPETLVDGQGRARFFATVLGTPTAIPPQWFLAKYPNVLQKDADGHVRGMSRSDPHGTVFRRCEHCCS